MSRRVSTYGAGTAGDIRRTSLAAGTAGDIRRTSLAQIDEAPPAMSFVPRKSITGEQQRVEVNKEKLRFGDIVFFRMIADRGAGAIATGAGASGSDTRGKAPSDAASANEREKFYPFLQAEGFSDGRIGMLGDDPDPRKFHYSLFRVVPKLSYDSLKSMDKLTRRASAQAEDMRDLAAKVVEEKAKNADLVSKPSGGHVCFGDVVQLQHLHSEKFLALIPRAIAEKEKDNMAVALVEGGSDGAWFKFSPRWKVSGDGDTVLIGDQIKLSSVKLHGYAVHGAKELLDRDALGRYEVNLSASSSNVAWKLHLYSMWSAQDDGVLDFGEAVRLHHTEAGAFVIGTCNRMRSKAPYLDMAPSAQTPDGRVAKNTRAKTVFRVEAIERARGGAVNFNMAGSDYDQAKVVRFRHVPTGRYLAVDYHSSGLDRSIASKAGGHAALAKTGDGMYSTAEAGVMYAARLADTDDRSTHFHLVPVLFNANPDDERVLIENPQVRVQHIPDPATGLPALWLHDPAVEKEARSTSSSALSAIGNKVNRWLGFSTQCLDQDSFALQPASDNEVSLLAQISGAIDVMTEYTKILRKHKEERGTPVTNGETVQVIHALTDLIYSAFESTSTLQDFRDSGESVLECKGIPNRARQDQMREMKLIDELFWVLLFSVDPERGGFTMEQLANQKRHSAMLNVHRHVYKCITASFMDNRINESYIASHTFSQWRNQSEPAGAKDGAKYLDGIIGQLGFGAGAAECLTSLLTNNRDLLENRVGWETIDIFLDLIRSRGPSARFLKFLSSVASCNNRQVISKQELLLKMCYSVTEAPKWLHNRQQLMMETILDKDQAKLRPWVSKSDEDEKKQKGIKGPIDHGNYLGKTLVTEGMHDILVGWSCKKGWKKGSDALFYEPGDMGLAGKRPSSVSAELSRYMSRTGTPAERYQWVRLEDLVWRLRPERLCKDATGKSWDDYRSMMDTTPSEKDNFDKLKQLAEHYHVNLGLYAELCLDRSYNCIEYLKDQFSYELLVTAISNTKLPPRIRQSFSDLCIRLWVDRFPHEPMKVPSLARIYEKIGKLDIKAEDALPQYRLLDGNPLLRSGDPFSAFPCANKFHLMEDVISDFVDLQNGRSVIEHVNDNYLTLSLLECCQCLARFGFYNTTTQIADLVDPLVALLDGRMDVMTAAEAEKQDEERLLTETTRATSRTRTGTMFGLSHSRTVSTTSLPMKSGQPRAHFLALDDEEEDESKVAGSGHAEAHSKHLLADDDSGPQRWAFNEETQLVMNSKCEMLAVIDALSDVRLDFRLSQLLAVAKTATRMGGVGSLVHHHLGDVSEPAMCDVRRLFRKKHNAEHEGIFDALRKQAISESTTASGDAGFCVTNFGFDKFDNMFGSDYAGLDMDAISDSPLVTICFDLMMYQSPDVFEAAFKTLLRHFSQRQSLLKCLREVQLLVNPSTVAAYQVLERELSMVRNRFESYETWGVANEFSPVQDDVVQEVLATLKKLTLLCTDARTNEPVRETQNLLRALKVSDVIIKALVIPIPEGPPGHLHEIKKLCNQFFKAFVRDNKKNQARAHRFMSIFLSNMKNLLGAAPAITAIFSHNPSMCTKVSVDLIDAFVSTIRSKSPAKSIQFLMFLDGVIDTLIPMAGQTLKDKQLMLLKQLAANNNAAVLLLFNDPTIDPPTPFDEIKKQPGYQERLRIMSKSNFDPVFAWEVLQAGTSTLRRSGGDDDIETCTQQVIYHSNLLALLGKLCAGKTASTEVKCQTMLPLEHVLCVAMDEETVLPVRAAMIKFLHEVYFETEISDFSSMETNDDVWLLMARLAADLQEYADGAPERLRAEAAGKRVEIGVSAPVASAASVAIGNFTRDYIFVAVLPAIDSFATTFCFKDGGITEDDPNFETFELVKKATKAIVKCGDSTEKQRGIAISTGVSLNMYSEDVAERLDLSANHDAMSQGADMASGRIGDLGSKAPEDVMANYAHALENSKLVQEACSMEFLNFVDAFLHVEEVTDPFNPEYLEKRHNHDKGIEKDMRINKISLEALARRTVEHVRSRVSTGDANLNIGALRVLREIIQKHRPYEEDEVERLAEVHVKEVHEKYTAMQDKMCDCGAVGLVVDIVSDSAADDLLVIAALELGIELLVDGNLYVQTVLFEYLTTNKNHLFFSSIERRIVRARTAVKLERKRKKAQRRSSRKDVLAFVEETDGVDYVRMNLVGQFLQLCCEGHNLQVQDLLRDQGSAVDAGGVPWGFLKTSNLIDVTTDLVVYIAKDDMKVRDMGEDDAEDIGRALDFLIEACQGPCHKNQELLSKSGMVDACMRIISQRLRGLEAELIKDTKAKAVKALASLLEGRSDNIVHRVLVMRLDPPVILQNRIVAIHNDFKQMKAEDQQEHKLDKDWDEEYLDEGFDLLTMAKALGREDADFQKLIDPIASEVVGDESSYREHAVFLAAGAKHKAREEYREAFEFFTAKVRSVEILWNNQLERIFFPLPSECAYLDATIKGWVKAKLDFSSDDRVRDFLQFVNPVTDETQHLEALNEFRWYRRFAHGRRLQLFKSLAFFLALLMNFIMLVALRKKNVPGGKFAYVYTPPVMRSYQQTLGAIQVFTSTAVLCFLLINRGPLVYKKMLRIKRNTDQAFDLGLFKSPTEMARMAQRRIKELKDAFLPWFSGAAALCVLYMLLWAAHPTMPIGYLFWVIGASGVLWGLKGFRQYWSDPATARLAFPVSFVYNVGYDVLLNPNTFFYVLYVLFAILGLTWYQPFYCFHLLDLVVISPSLQNVVRSVTQPIQSLAMTALLGLFTVYIFSLVGFYAFPHDFYSESLAGDECGTMVMCFTTFLYNGLLSGGGIADYMSYKLGWSPQVSCSTVRTAPRSPPPPAANTHHAPTLPPPPSTRRLPGSTSRTRASCSPAPSSTSCSSSSSSCSC